MFKTNNLFVKNFSIYFLGLAISGLISFMTIPLIVRNFGIEKYGIFSLVQNVILVLISFGGGWLNQCILRFNNFSSSFKVMIFHLYLIIFIPLSLVCFILLKFLGNSILLCLIGVITMFLGSVSALSITFHQSKFNARMSFYFDFIRIVTFVLMILFFYHLFKKINSTTLLIISFFVSYLSSFLFLLKIDFRFLIISVKIFFSRLNFNYIHLVFKEHIHLVNYGWPLAFWFTVSSLLNVSDRYIIGYYLNAAELGTYSAIYDLLYKGITLLYSPILVAGYPIMAKKYNQGNKKSAFQFLKKLILFEVIIFLVIVTIAFFLKSFFIKSVVGIPISSQSLKLIMPLICGAFVWQLAMLIHKPLEFELKTKTMLIFVVIAFLVNIILNFIFISDFGVLFAAYSTLISAILYLMLNVFWILKLKNK
jgi:O-antigen/teichoic acid export membrane protein